MYPPIKYTYSKPIAISLLIGFLLLTAPVLLAANDNPEFWHRDTGSTVFFGGYLLMFGVSMPIYVIIGMLLPALKGKAVVVINEYGVYSEDWGSVPWSSIDKISKQINTNNKGYDSKRAILLLFKDAALPEKYLRKKRAPKTPIKLIIPLSVLTGDSDKIYDQILDYFNYYRQQAN